MNVNYFLFIFGKKLTFTLFINIISSRRIEMNSEKNKEIIGIIFGVPLLIGLFYLLVWGIWKNTISPLLEIFTNMKSLFYFLVGIFFIILLLIILFCVLYLYTTLRNKLKEYRMRKIFKN